VSSVVPSVSSSTQSQLQVSALPVSTDPPASYVTSRDEDVATPFGSPADASSCSTLFADYKRLIIPKVKLGSELSSVERLDL